MFNKKEFIEFLIEQKALLFGDFTTKSGRQSPYFINMGEFKSGEAMRRLGGYYASHIMNLVETGNIPHCTLTLFGPAYKGIPLCVSAASSLSSDYGTDAFWTFNRKEVKDHGEGGSFVGKKLDKSDSVLILDDVITAGTAIREVLPILSSAGVDAIHGLIVAVDRMERGKGEGLSAVDEVRRDFGINVFPIITVRDIIEYLSVIGDSEAVAKMEAYLAQYGV